VHPYILHTFGSCNGLRSVCNHLKASRRECAPSRLRHGQRRRPPLMPCLDLHRQLDQEINKLAFNIPMGRTGPASHYAVTPQPASGWAKKVAISYCRTWSHLQRRFPRFSLTRLTAPDHHLRRRGNHRARGYWYSHSVRQLSALFPLLVDFSGMNLAGQIFFDIRSCTRQFDRSSGNELANRHVGRAHRQAGIPPVPGQSRVYALTEKKETIQAHSSSRGSHGAGS